MAGNDSLSSLGGLDYDRLEGEILASDLLSLGMSDEDIARAIGNRVERSEQYWNEKLNLDKVRERNEKYYLGTYLDEDKLYDFQVPYKDNRIFNAIETLVPMALGNPAQPVVTEAFDTEASRELAMNHEKWLLGKYEDLYLKGKFELVARHLLQGTRIAFMKYRWDTTIGQLQSDGTRFGDVAVDVLRPQRVVVDAGATNPDDIPLIGEFQTDTVEGLCYRFPEKKDQVMKELGFQRGVATQMNKQTGFVEVWFTYYDKSSGQKMEGVAWKLKTLVLKGIKNPNWNYDETQKTANGVEYNNFFDRPRKPYIIFNHLNTGRYLIDETSLSEQAQPLQDVLDKRGRQLVENADQANSGTVFNSDMISPDNVAELIGDPGEKLMAKGDVQKAAMRLPTNLLPDYVIQDKLDARHEIDEIFGTHSVITDGGKAATNTLGQEVLAQRADVSRAQTLAMAIEDGADRLYKGLTQMAKVFYDEPQLQRFQNPVSQGGGTTFTTYSRDQIEPNIQVRVKSGSVLPDDKIAKEQQTIQMMAILDPLSIGEGIGKQNPVEFAKRLMFFRMFPDRYMTEILKDDGTGNPAADPSAIQEQQMIANGQQVPPQQNPTKEHLQTHQAFIESPQFKQLPPEIQAAMIQHLKAELANAKGALGMDSVKPGVPQEQQNGIQTEQPAKPEAPSTPEPAQQTPQPPVPSGTPAQQGFLGRLVNAVRG